MRRRLPCYLLTALLCPHPGHAQTGTNGPLSLPLTDAVERVISEEPTRLVRLRGDLLANNPEAVDYASMLLLKGAENCTISVFNTPGDTTACWKAELPVLDDFDQAKKAYRSLYESLHSARITRLHPGTVYRLQAPFQEASETKQTNTIEFVVDPAGDEFRKVRVQIMLSYVMPEWHLAVQVYEKDGELGMRKGDDE